MTKPGNQPQLVSIEYEEKRDNKMFLNQHTWMPGDQAIIGEHGGIVIGWVGADDQLLNVWWPYKKALSIHHKSEFDRWIGNMFAGSNVEIAPIKASVSPAGPLPNLNHLNRKMK